jgi:putative nucleotidyltransferase with HDIG domain
MSIQSFPISARHTIFFILLFIVTFALAFIGLLIPLVAPLSAPPLQAGLVAPQDIQAPRAITYQSNLLTEEQREAAALAVPPVYSPPDTSIARSQLERLQATLAYISTVRADTYSTPEQKINDLTALEDIQMHQDLATSLLALSDLRWQAIQQEAIVVLEQVMRSTIREDRLDDVRRTLPTLVSLSLSEDQAAIVAKLVDAFIAPNSFYSEELTNAARQKARLSVSPVTKSFKAGETIVQRGSVITSNDLEALQEFGLVQSQHGWKDFASAAMLAFLAIVFVSFYLRRNPKLIQDVRSLTLIAFLFLIFLIGARLLIPGHTLIPYIFPFAAYGMCVAVLVGIEPALITTSILAILAAYGLPFALELVAYYTIGSFFGILTLGRARRVMYFIFAGAAVAASGLATSVIYRLPEPATDLVGLTSIGGAALLNGFASAGLTIALQLVLAQFLGMTTALQLMEISRPDHPLLQYLLRSAPGTYQHSLQVANLAEQAAERIGADTLLTRVGALYHDIGKAKNPAFFIENQVIGNINPHDDLDPISSAQTVIRHVPDGLELARKHRLPKRIQDFIGEHHGTMITRYQYANALKATNGNENQIDKEQFRYPGPKPRSRETAILMLADGCEARVRAEGPKDEKELREIIRSVVEHRLSQGELEHTSLTMQDMTDLVDSFTATLRGMYHPRIEYPKLESAIPSSIDSSPTVPFRAKNTSETAVPVETESHATQLGAQR